MKEPRNGNITYTGFYPYNVTKISVRYVVSSTTIVAVHFLHVLGEVHGRKENEGFLWGPDNVLFCCYCCFCLIWILVT